MREEMSVTPNEIARVQDYLRKTFANPKINVAAPMRRGGPIEVKIGDEFIGVLHRDEDDGEVSYALQISILEEDLPAVSPVRGATDPNPKR
jgi:hypothetical protein